MSKILTLISFLILNLSGYCTVYYSIADGNFLQASNWSPPQVPDMSNPANVVHLYHDMYIPLNGQYNCKCTLTIYTYASLYTPNQFRVNSGHIICWGYLDVHNNLWMENGGILEVWYGGFVFVDNKITYNEVSTILLRGGTICWHNLWKGDDPDGVGVLYNDPHLEGIKGCYVSTGPLGIDLLEFNASCKNDFVEINWATENEENNDHFTIEKSDDLKQWRWVADYPGKEHARGRNEYTIKDDDIRPGAWYYRISQTDLNGTTKIYNDVWLRYTNCYEAVREMVLPNPARDQITLYRVTEIPEKYEIYDIYGSEVLNFIASQQEVIVSLQSLSRGIYFVHTASGKSLKFIKE